MPPPTTTSNGTAKLLNTVNFFTLAAPGIDQIGMFMECHGLELSFEVLQYAEGGNNESVHQLPGRLTYPNLSLVRGMTDEKALYEWFNQTRTKAELKEITLTLQNAKKATIRSWTFADAFPVRWTGPSFAATSAGIATETLEIAHGGLKGV